VCGCGEVEMLRFGDAILFTSRVFRARLKMLSLAPPFALHGHSVDLLFIRH
jgi:hypothetical protein